MSFKNTVKLCLTENYWSFDGRASRTDFWSFALFLVGVHLTLTLFTGTWQMKPLVGYFFDTPYGFYLLRAAGTVIALVLVIPSIAVTIRRLHDSGLSGWYYLGFVLIAALMALGSKTGELTSAIFMLVALAITGFRKGKNGENRFGPAPEKAGHNSETPPSDFTIGPKRLWIGLRPQTAIIALSVMGIMGLVDGAFANLSRPDPDPFFNPNRQQVTLRDPGPDGRWRTNDDAVWALSFPKAANVEPTLQYRMVTMITAEDIDNARKYGTTIPQKVHQPPKPVFETSTLKLLVSLPDLGDTKGSFVDQSTTTLEISLPSERRFYDGRSDWGKNPSFVREYEKLSRIDCEADVEIAPGVTRLREVSRETKKSQVDAIRNYGLRHNSDGTCLNRNVIRGAGYAVADKNGGPTGFGRCETYSHTAEFGTCRFEFWLPQDRIVEYRFSEKFLPMLREIDEFARARLAQASVAKESKNIPHLDGNSRP